ncbi:hypothetical protein RUM44_006724 [Polyplax serrata]|uniref:Uncharacterized protein n=1 Tax=Polyplax serrata TaxID=468196 RepID=A0ABR1AIX3_POLSC
MVRPLIGVQTSGHLAKDCGGLSSQHPSRRGAQVLLNCMRSEQEVGFQANHNPELAFLRLSAQSSDRCRQMNALQEKPLRTHFPMMEFIKSRLPAYHPGSD